MAAKGTSKPTETARHPRDSEIAAVDCFPARMRMVKPLVMSTYRIDDGPVLFVRVRARSGAEGWGECACNALFGGETLKGMVNAVEELIAPRLMGRSALDRVAISLDMRHQVYANAGAKAAVDMALLDLAGRIQGVRAVDLLGGAARSEARVLRLVGGAGQSKKDFQEAAAVFEQGYHAFKLKVGVGRLEDDAETVRLMREAFGPKTFVSADCNMGWTVAEARRFCDIAARNGLDCLEQPVEPSVEKMAAVARFSAVPLCADESVHSLGDILALHAAGAIGGASLKTVKLGGITPLMSAAHMCDGMGLSVNLAMMMETSLATAAMVSAACAVPQMDWGLSLGTLFLADDPMSGQIVTRKGMVLLPEGPGLGITVEEAVIRRFAPK